MAADAYKLVQRDQILESFVAGEMECLILSDSRFVIFARRGESQGGKMDASRQQGVTCHFFCVTAVRTKHCVSLPGLE